MDLAPFLVLPLVGGYSFSVIWYATKYVIARESGHKLYFRAIFYGVFLFIASALLHVILFSLSDIYRNAVSLLLPVFNNTEIHLFSKESRLAILLGSYFLGPFLAILLNSPAWFTSRFWPEWLLDLSARTKMFWLEQAIADNDFERLVYESCLFEMPVMFTLENGKVYVGTVNFLPNPTLERRSIRIFPFLSGYRDPETHTFEITTNYYETFKQLINSDGNQEQNAPDKPTGISPDVLEGRISVGEFDIIIPASQISSCHFFDSEIYVQFLKQRYGDKIDE